MYAGNYKMFIKEVKGDQNKWRHTLCQWTERQPSKDVNIFKISNPWQNFSRICRYRQRIYKTDVKQ